MAEIAPAVEKDTVSFGVNTRRLFVRSLERVITGHELIASALGICLTVVIAINRTVGNSITKSYSGIPPWLAAIPLVGLFLWALSREHHATVNRLLAQRSNLTGRVEELTAKVAELEEVVPVVSFGVPRTEEQVPVMGGTQPFAFGVVRNDQKRPGFGETARDAIVFLTVEGLGGERIMGPIKGRWRDAPSPVQLPAFQHHTHLESIDLQANGDEREFDIATKSLSEPYCYVIDAKQVLHKIPVLGVMLVQVEVRGKNFAPVRDTLTLNTKGYGEGLDVWRATS